MKNLLSIWQTLSLRSRIVAAAMTTGIVVGTATLAWWATTPTYAVLFNNVSADDSTAIAADLGRWHVPYRLDANGQTLMVPESAIASTRMRLAAQGLPNHGTVGFELFNQTDYGMTDFTQQVDYQRALQGELARTIMSLSEVRYARVHLTLKQKGVFLQSEDHPKASITIALKPGRTLNAAEINGIQRLTAAAVDGLQAKDVVILDDTGAPLSSPDPSGTTVSDVDARLKEKRQLETALQDKIEHLLKSVFGLQRFAVSVDVTLNFDKIKDVDQQVLPQGADGNGLVTMKKETRTVAPAASGTGASHDNNVTSEVEYAHSTSVKEINYATGRVEHVSVGILVPDSMSTAQLRNLHDVVAAAMGYDAKRGDQIELSSWHFASVVEARPATPHAATVQASASAPKQAVISYRWLRSPFGIALLIALIALVIGALMAGVLRSGTRRRLTTKERQVLLNELRTWLAQPEGTGRE